MRNFVFLGPPGSGKGTQATRLSQKVGIRHLSTGDLLRNAVQEQTALGMQAKEYMEKGDLVPDQLLLGLLEESMNNGAMSKGTILDGFPRTVPQAESLRDMLNKNNMKVDAAVLLEVSDEEVIKRLSGRWFCTTCQRTYNYPMHAPKKEGICDDDGHELQRRRDDEEEVVRKRLHIYRERTAPIVDFYRAESILTTICGEQSPDKVFSDLLEVIQ